MRLKTALLAAVALTALICVAWLGFGGRSADPERALVQEQSLEPLAPGSADTELLPGAAGLEIAAKDNRSATSERAAVEREMSATPEPRDNTRGIEGRVVDALGVPVAGAEVYIAARSTFSTGSLAAMAKSESDFLDVEQTETGDRGAFSFDSSLRGEIQIEVHAPGFSTLREVREVAGGDQATLDDLVIEHGVPIAGRVVDQDGNGVSGVAIHEVQQQSGGMTINFFGGAETPLTTSGAGGAFQINELAGGPFRLRLDHDDHPSLEVGGTSAPGAAEFVYQLEPGFKIRGVVRDLSPGDEKRFAVRARPADGAGIAIAAGMSVGRLAELAADGQFELRGLREGPYTLHVVAVDDRAVMFAAGRSAAVRANTGASNVELSLRGRMGLTFQVVDADSGLPCTNFEVEYGQGWMSTLRDDEGEPLTQHPEGRVTMDDLVLQGGASELSLSVAVEGYAPLRVDDISLIPGDVLDLGLLRAQPVPLIAVQVLDDASGEPVAGAWVTLSEMPPALEDGTGRVSMTIGGFGGDDDLADMLGGDSNRAKTDKSGLAEVPSLPGKRCKMKVTHRDYADHSEANIDLPATGSDELVVRMRQGGTVIVTVLDANGEPKKGERVRESLVGRTGPLMMGGSGARKTRSDGTVTFKHLVEGAHRFQIAEDAGGMSFVSANTQIAIGGGGASEQGKGQIVQVVEAATSEVTLHASPEGIFRGTLTEGGLPLAGATLTFSEVSEDSSDDVGMMMSQSFGGGTTTRTNSKGDFSREGLKVGAYTLTITHPGRSMPTEFEIDVREGDNKADFDLGIAILEGRILDSNGEPAVGVEVRPERDTQGAGSAPQRTRMVAMTIVGDGGGGAMSFSTGGPEAARTTTDENGRYSLRGVAPNVKLVVVSSSDRFQEARSDPVELSDNQTRSDADMTVFAAGSLRILARKPDGSEASYCMATLEFVGEADPRPGREREFLGESGEATVRSLRPGVWSVKARSVAEALFPDGATPQPVFTDTVEIEVLPGETVEVLLELGAG